MSLAKRNNGCLECRTRRVICDKTEPECFKCRKKGIKCSGQGIECRFSPYMRKSARSSRSATARPSKAAPVAEVEAAASEISTTAQPIPPKRYRWVDPNATSTPSPKMIQFVPVVPPEMDEEPTAAKQQDPTSTSSSPSSTSIPSKSLSISDKDTHVKATDSKLSSSSGHLVIQRPRKSQQPWLRVPDPGQTIQSITSDSRFFFDHFSTFIASKMVVLDFNNNGYRQIILPLATQDPTVSQAVGVVSAFHLAQQVPSLRIKAEIDQQHILSQLRQLALMPSHDHFFKLSTWATVLMLLVGDTITGSSNYIYLLGLLSRLSQAALSNKSLPDNVKQFVTQQTQMFELFGCPLSSKQKGLGVMRRQPWNYLDFMSYCPCSPEQRKDLAVMTDAMRQACDIFQNRASHNVTSESSIASVERLRQTVIGMESNTDGSHALVWPYFIAAAESNLPEHRDFFYRRLDDLFSCTRFGSIPIALDTLKYIWSKSDTTSWTDIVTNERQVLIM